MRYCYSTLLLLGSLCLIAKPTIAQSIQAGDSGTVVTPVGNQFNITGNQVSGKNQFHNFQTFNVDAGKTANFIPNNATIQNILSRVSGGTPSQIQGIIQSTSGVNLFLMNPSGILFGNGASLNVNGSFTATTANAIGFSGNNWFNAVGNSNLVPLTGDPTQFAFTNINPGAIVNTGNLTLPANQSLNLIGGTVINTGTIATPGGNITIAAVEGGKAVQISTPGSILSYTLPVEAISAINPAIGNPVSLPELLTGSPLSNASGIEIKNGVVTLINSQTALSDSSGLTAISGTVSTAGSNGDSITINGKTITIVDPTINTNNATLSFEADRRLIFEDQADDTLTIGDFRGTPSQVKFTANSSNGVIESIDPNDTITVTGSSLFVSASRINLSNLNVWFGVKTSVGVSLTATNDIQTGDIKTAGGGVEILSQEGNIKARNISAPTDKFTNKLTATQGSIEVNSIFAGSVHAIQEPGLALEIFAGKTFRVIGTIWDSYQYPLSLGEDQIFDFLQTKVGKPSSEIRSSFKGRAAGETSLNPSVQVNAPISIHVGFGGAQIRYMGGEGEIIKLDDNITIQGGKNRFEIGPRSEPNAGDLYIPRDSGKTFDTFMEEPFALVRNVNYQKIVISEGASGSVGGIIRTLESNGSVWVGTLDRAFGVVIDPVVKDDPLINNIVKDTPAVKDNPFINNIPTIDLETRNPSKLATCPQLQTITTASTRSPSSNSNPCTSDNNDDEILKILK